MKRLLVVFMSVALVLALGYGCGKKETEQPGKVPAEVKKEEMKDTTRMDTAMVDTGVMEETEMPEDTM